MRSLGILYGGGGFMYEHATIVVVRMKHQIQYRLKTAIELKRMLHRM